MGMGKVNRVRGGWDLGRVLIAVGVVGLVCGPALRGQSLEDAVNPIVAGDWSDPAVMRVGGDYYSLRSSFGWQPGLPIIHSKDLTHWRYVGYVYASHPDIPPGRPRAGAYGSEIGFNPNNNTTLVYTPIDSHDRHVSAYVADHPQGPYRGPIAMDVPGFDPGFFADEDKRLYLVTNKAIILELTADGLAVKREVADLDKKARGSMFEGPDLFKHGDYYYCVYSTGGTRPHQNSAVNAMRARRLEGPWEEDPANPLLRADADTGARFQGPAHGTVLATPDGQWFVTYHAFELTHYSLGRQMCLERVRWTDDGWWRPIYGRIPSAGSASAPAVHTLDGSDEFTDPTLGKQWFFQASPDFSGASWSLTDRPGWLRIKPEPGDLSTMSSLVNVFCQRVTLKEFDLTARLAFTPSHDGAMAGLHAFHDPGMNFWLASTMAEGRLCLEVGRYDNGRNSVLRRVPNPWGPTVFLRIHVDGAETATFLVSGDGRTWQRIDASIYFGDSWHDLRDGVGGRPDLGWVGIKKRNVWTAAACGVFAVGGTGARGTDPPATAPGPRAPADFDWCRITP